LLERYNYTPQTGGEGIPQVGPELTEGQRDYALQTAAREGVPVVGEAAPVADAAEEGLLKIGDVTAKYDPETNTYVDLATNRRVKELADFLKPEETYAGDPVRMAMGGLAHSLGAETPQTMVPMRASSPAQEVVVPVGMYRNARVPAFKTGGRATIADMARHYGARR
jgi:hypothetical protein